MTDTEGDISPSTSPPMLVTREARFTALYEDHAAEIHAYCLRRLPAADAGDAVAEIFTVAWRRLDQIDDGSMRAWLYGVARGVLANHWRSSRRRDRLRLRLANAPSRAEIGPDVSVDQDGEVLRALAGLSERDREILQLATWEELSGPEIAITLGISEAAVHQRLHRARHRLAARIEAEGSPRD